MPGKSRSSREIGRNSAPPAGRLATEPLQPRCPTPLRSRIMASIGPRDTEPELAVRRALHAAGLRFRLHAVSLPGRPDLVLPRFRSVVFVHGCFWHRHIGCRRSTIPRRNRAWWVDKLRRNRARDRRNQRALHELGWRVFVVWECEVERRASLDALIRRISSIRPAPARPKR